MKPDEQSMCSLFALSQFKVLMADKDTAKAAHLYEDPVTRHTSRPNGA